MKTVVLVIVVLHFLPYVISEPEMILKFQICDVEPNRKIAEANCSINVKNGENKLSTYITIRNNITAIRAQTKMSFVVPLAGPIPVVDYTEPDMCQAFNSSAIYTVMLMALNDFPDIGHLPIRCPVEDGLYYIRDLFLPSSVIPSYLPSGDFQVNIKLFGTTESQEVFLFYNITIRGSVQPARRVFRAKKLIPG